MTARDIIYIAAIVVVAIGIRELFPKKGEVRTIPRIVTVHDTVHTRPQPLKIIEHTTDTFNLVIKQTIHDTVVIHVGDTTGNHGAGLVDSIWPLLQYRQRTRDTAEVRTFSLRTGWAGVSTVYTPGPLTALDIDSTPTPRMSFGVWSVGPTFFQKVKYVAYGVAACRVADLLKR